VKPTLALLAKESPKKNPRNPRVTINPKAYQALCVQAALEMLTSKYSGLQDDPLPSSGGPPSSPGYRKRGSPHEEAQDQLPEKETKAFKEGMPKLPRLSRD